MSFCQVQWHSKVLGKALDLNVLLPNVGEPPFPVFYLLHGLSDDYSIWHRRTRIEWYVRDLPLIVVMPDGYRGFYTNHENGPDYATYMAEELPAFVERNFQAKPSRDARCVGGLSMGGYGAMRLALGYPDVYCSANSHSGALVFGHETLDIANDRSAEWELIVGASPTGSDHDLFALAERRAADGNAPALRIDCGTEDFLIEHNRRFTAHLNSLGVEHEYEEFPGSHTWDYWDLHIQQALAFHARNLGIAPA
jgi:S-formylglutathione hydrolase FrmB